MMRHPHTRRPVALAATVVGTEVMLTELVNSFGVSFEQALEVRAFYADNGCTWYSPCNRLFVRSDCMPHPSFKVFRAR